MRAIMCNFVPRDLLIYSFQESKISRVVTGNGFFGETARNDCCKSVYVPRLISSVSVAIPC